LSPFNSDKAEKEINAVLKKISAFPSPLNDIGLQLHETVMSAGPKVAPRIWYGMPGYALSKSKPVLIFFRVDDGLITFGLTEKAQVNAESGSTLRPCAWYLSEIDKQTLDKISKLVRVALS
jgi:hypothetical protein